MAKIYYSFLILFLLTSTLHAAQSLITEAEGYSCTSKKKSARQARSEAYDDAKRKAREQAVLYIGSGTKMDNAELEKDLTGAYSHTNMKILESKDLGWRKTKKSGKCLKVFIKAEVAPDEALMEKMGLDKQFTDAPSAPLRVQAWTDKEEYKKGEKIKIYLKGNKPFYASVLYKDTKGALLQLLPNPYNEDNYFNENEVIEIPSNKDKFIIEVDPPFGKEEIVIYAGTFPPGEFDLTPRGSVYSIKTKTKDLGEKARRVQLKKKPGDKDMPVSEFFQNTITISTAGPVRAEPGQKELSGAGPP
ncbi:MAG: DUF4384 domain-containing protein [Nitrospiraceae bacterium]|nr:MAG: DUF4384 domain-containing protein [Nitrospiraceae bacterium]